MENKMMIQVYCMNCNDNKNLNFLIMTKENTLSCEKCFKVILEYNINEGIVYNHRYYTDSIYRNISEMSLREDRIWTKDGYWIIKFNRI